MKKEVKFILNNFRFFYFEKEKVITIQSKGSITLPDERVWIQFKPLTKHQYRVRDIIDMSYYKGEIHKCSLQKNKVYSFLEGTNVFLKNIKVSQNKVALRYFIRKAGLTLADIAKVLNTDILSVYLLLYKQNTFIDANTQEVLTSLILENDVDSYTSKVEESIFNTYRDESFFKSRLERQINVVFSISVMNSIFEQMYSIN